jgi:tetratricopeptide (TPR) repeat protein
MRLLSKLLLIFLFTLFSAIPTLATVNGRVDYSIPIDYSKLSETELENRASYFYDLAFQSSGSNLNENITNALNLYSILQNINPNNISYCIKTGNLYSKIKQDKYAKGNYSKAIGINSASPEPYFYLGEFYYQRQLYRKALKYYKESYSRGDTNNYTLLYHLGDVYEKLGDTKSSLTYLNSAYQINPTSDLKSKINKVQSQNSINREYYSKK